MLLISLPFKLWAVLVHPSPRAEPTTLLRRLSLDLTGLPPTLEELETYEFAVASKGPDEAYLELVERLLSSPHYGERWGRHWLDVGRYVQGKTKVAAVDRIDMAEPYRDYVVRVSMQTSRSISSWWNRLRGILLLEMPLNPHPETSRSAAAPGFLSIGPWLADCADPNTLRMDIIDEQISTTQVFCGSTSRPCHDHFRSHPDSGLLCSGRYFRKH